MKQIEDEFQHAIEQVGASMRERLIQSLCSAGRFNLSHADVEDCVQIAWITAYQTLRTTDSTRIAAFITLVARRRAIDLVRRKRRLTVVAEIETDFSSDEIPHERFELNEQIALLFEKLNALSIRQRHVATMRYLLDVRPEEICRTLKLSRKQYEGVLDRARIALEGELRTFTVGS